MVEVVEIRAPLPAESAHPNVRHVARLGFSSCYCGVCDAVSAVTYAHASPIVEYVTPARTVACAAPVTTITVASTVFPTATVPITPVVAVHRQGRRHPCRGAEAPST